MSFRNYSWGFLLLFVYSCHVPYSLTKTEAEEIKLSEDRKTFDAHVDSLIIPYRISLDKEMNRVLAYNEKTISKGQPESELGNLLADMLLQYSQKYAKRRVDFAILNNGGIRIPQLPEGNVTLGKIFEIMPFDNAVVVLEMNGKDVKALLDLLAEGGGVPIAGARFKIKNNQAEAIFIANVELDLNKTYYMAVSDYLANGGDKLDILKSQKQFATDSLLRDLFIHAFEDYGKWNKPIKTALEKRIEVEK